MARGVSWRFCTPGAGKNGDGEFWWGSFGGLVKVFGIGPVMVIAFIHMDGGPTPPTQSWGIRFMPTDSQHPLTHQECQQLHT